MPRRITKDSSFAGCRWMGTTVPVSTAFRNRWHLSSSDWLKPCAEITPNKADYKASISSSPVGSYGPSLTSMMTVPDSRARTVCHWPMGMSSGRLPGRRARVRWPRCSGAPTRHRTPPPAYPLNKPPFRRISGADEWAAESPARWRSTTCNNALQKLICGKNSRTYSQI